jgi:hypothetical protein
MRTQPTLALPIKYIAGYMSTLAEWLGLSSRLGWGLGVVAATAILLSTPAQAQTTVPGKIPGQFAVSPSGAATYSIPIQVPPGIAGMQPKLSLEYNSQAGNGIMGMGWSLAGLSSITRCPATMAQDGVRGGVNYDGNDKFCLDGQRLIVVSGAYGAAGSEYRTEVEGFSKVTATGLAGSGPESFVVNTKAGLTMEYGNPGVAAASANARIEAQGKSSVMIWALNKITDIKGNSMSFAYYEDNANGAFLPASVSYADNSVQFVYDTVQRPDIQTAYQAGSRTTLSQRLKTIATYVGVKAIATTNIQYSQSPDLQKSNISSVQLCDGANICLAPTTIFSNEMKTTGFVDAGNYFVGGWAYPADGTGVRDFVMDVNGDGKSDLVRLWNNQNSANAQVWSASTGTSASYMTINSSPVSQPLKINFQHL